MEGAGGWLAWVQKNPAPPMSEPTSPAELQRSPGFWESVREAIGGSRQDFTQGSLGRAILLLAVPMILEMVMESVFAIVDVFWVSRLGADAVATVGITESMLAIVYAVSLGLSMSAAAMVARRIGERNPDQAAVSAVQAIGVGVVVGLVVGATGTVLAPKLLQLMGASPQLVASGYRYTSVTLGSSFVILQLFLINAIFRGAGDAAIAMRVLWLANLINLVLDPCLIFGLCPFPALGVTCAAVATTTGRSVGVIFQLVTLARGRSRIVVRREHLQLQPIVMLRLVRLSASGILQVAIGTATW